MFDKFTDRARRVFVLAQDEARALKHGHTGSEHILLGLIAEGEGAAAVALARVGVNLLLARMAVKDLFGEGSEALSGYIPYTMWARQVMELSVQEAQRRNDSYIGTEHVLLALLQVGDSGVALILNRLGADPSRVREALLLLLGSFQPR